MASNWAYVGCSDFATGSGPTGSVQFHGPDTSITGSYNFMFHTASYEGLAPNTLVLTGTLVVTGTISASHYHIKDVTMIDGTGSTKFGDTLDDTHIRTGSLLVSSSYTNPTSFMTHRVGIGTRSPSGSLHIKVGAGAGASAWSARDDIVIDSDDRTGVTILTPGGSNEEAGYAMGVPGDTRTAGFELDYDSSLVNIGAYKSGLKFFLRSGNGVAALTLDANQHVTASNNLIVADAILAGPASGAPELSAGVVSASAGITGSAFLTDGAISAGVVSASAGLSGSHAKIDGVVSGGVFLGDGSSLTGIAGGSSFAIFSEISSTRASTTSSIGIGHAAAVTPQALLYLTASDAQGNTGQPYFYIDSVNLSKPPLYVTASSYATSRLPLVGIGTRTPTYTLTVEGDISGSTVTATTITGSTLMGGTDAGGLSLSGSRVMVTGSLLPVGVSASLNVSASAFYSNNLYLGAGGINYPEVKSPNKGLYLDGNGGGTGVDVWFRSDGTTLGGIRSGSTDGIQTMEIWSDGLGFPISFNSTYMGGIQHTQLLLDTANRISTFSGSVRIYDENSSKAGLTVTGSTRLSGSFAGGYRRITTDYEVKDHLAYNYIIGVSASLTTKVNIVLPSASVGRGHTLIIKDEFAGYAGGARTEQYAITASVSSSADLVDGESEYYIYGAMGSITLYSDGANKWFVG